MTADLTVYYIWNGVAPTLTPTPTETPWWPPVEQVLLQDEAPQEQAAFSELLSRIRDEVLAADPKGEAYIRLVYSHAPEIMKLLLENEDVRKQVKELALELRPLLASMVDKEPADQALRVQLAWVRRALRVMEQIEVRASPQLREEIRRWKERLPGFVGKTGLEIWEMLPERTE